MCYEDECLESSIFTFEHKLDRHYVHFNNSFQLSLTLERDQNMILMLYHLTLRLKKHFPYKFRIEFFVRANFSTRLLKMSDILDPIDEYTFDPFTSKELSDCTQQYNSSPCLVFFARIILYGQEENSKLCLNLLDENPSGHNHYHQYCQSNFSLTKQLFQNGKFSDIKIKVSQREFHVHRCILSLASEVFERMFHSDMIETRSNLIEITDLTEEICEEMLRFIYCNEIQNLDLNALDLLYAADKYAIEHLKNLCIQTLIDTFTYESAAEMLIRANIYNSKLLKDNLLVFIKTYSKEVFATEQWKQLERTQ